MAITAYTGLPGHGKTYTAVDNVIIPSLESGRPVYTNIPMNDDLCLEELGSQVVYFDVQELVDNPRWWFDVFEPGAILVIDECARLWPSGIKQNNARGEDIEFLTQHRHMVNSSGMSTDIVLVTQDLAQIAAFARNLVETTFRVKQLTSVGLKRNFRVDVYSFPVTGPAPNTRKRDRAIQGVYSKSVYRFYKSQTKSAAKFHGKEITTDKRANALGGFKVKAFIVVACVLSFMVFTQLPVLLDQFRSSEEEVVYEFEPEPVTSVVASSALEPAIQPAREQLRNSFRFLSRAEGIYIDLSHGAFPNLEYQVRIEFDDQHVSLSSQELTQLHYALKPVNYCMVLIRGYDFDGYALCPRDSKPSTFIDGFVASTD